MNKDSKITELKGVGAKTEQLFQKLGVYTVWDILLHYPRDYTQYSKLIAPNEVADGKICAVYGRIYKTPVVKNMRNLSITTAQVGSEGSFVELTWFRMPYIRNTLKPGCNYVFYGKIVRKGNRMTMEQPAVYTLEKYQEIEGKLQPVYPLISGVTNNLLVKTVKQVLDQEVMIPDYLLADVREKYELCEINYAMEQIHFPESMDSLIEARKRLVFDEFFLFILGMQMQKNKDEKAANEFTFQDTGITERVLEQLPYELTGAQLRALADVKRDLRGEHVMQRLIQGDVGSGKTIVAYLAMLEAAENDYQSAIMVPTEVLARQHYENFCEMNEQFGIKHHVILLTGSMTAKEKRRAYDRMELYPDAMIIGTHALIQERALYDNLALVITDEQHRFGVKQREKFSTKGNHPHILVMSATPIPRTLAIIIYGDLDISVIDEVPARRLPIKNCVVQQNLRAKSYSFMEEEIRAGHQVYVICPLVEETETSDCEDVISYTEKLKKILPKEVAVAYLHGKMKAAEKNSIMEQFSKNEIQVLVSTTVIEVGVNVPNATVMMIENAERFGLAQLHQLRGRVGRGDAQSYCIMVNGTDSKQAKKRLETLNKSNDGFFIASEDLKLRGPGDFFGIRQSGEMNFKLADIYQDANVLQHASEEVKVILQRDENLEREEHRVLRQYLEEQYLRDHTALNI